MGRSGALDPALQLAERLIRTYGLTAAGLIFRENLATYLFEALGEKASRRLLELPGEVTLEAVKGHLRGGTWALGATRKIERELNFPYADEEVFAHLRFLQCVVQEELSRLQAMGPSIDFQFWIFGSLAKGRLGKHSDIDATVLTDNLDFRQRIRNYRSENPKVTIFVLEGKPTTQRLELLMKGPHIDLGNGDRLREDPHFIFHSYLETMALRGYDVAVSAPGVVEVRSGPAPRKRRPEVSFLVHRLYDLIAHPVWKAIAGWLIASPTLGPVVLWFMKLLVPPSVATEGKAAPKARRPSQIE